MIKLVVFDMAGTTINEDNVVYKTLLTAINKKGFNITLDQVLAEGAGMEKLQAIKNILKVYTGTTDNNLSDEIYAEFISLLTDAYENLQVMAQPNAEELFLNLRQKNIRIVLNTGYNAETAELLVKKLGWKKGVEYDSLISSSDVENNRE